MIYSEYKIKNFTELSEEEAIQVLRIRNSVHVRRWMRDKSPIKLADHIKFMNNLRSANDKKYFLAKKNDQFVGVYSLVGLNFGQAQGGFYLSEHAIQAELAIEFLHTMIDFIFWNENINKIFGFAMIENKNANAINTLLGFREDHNLEIKKQIGYIYTSLSKDDWISSYSKNPKLLKMLSIVKNLNKNEN